nr:hypothetical protein [Deltaproteobacteria bacterium]
ILLSAAVIAGVTVACCGAAGLAASRLGVRFGRVVALAGAAALIGLAVWLVVSG